MQKAVKPINIYSITLEELLIIHVFIHKNSTVYINMHLNNIF